MARLWGPDAPVAIKLEHSPLMFGYTSEGVLYRVMFDADDQRWVFDQLLDAYADAYREDARHPWSRRLGRDCLDVAVSPALTCSIGGDEAARGSLDKRSCR